MRTRPTCARVLKAADLYENLTEWCDTLGHVLVFGCVCVCVCECVCVRVCACGGDRHDSNDRDGGGDRITL